MAGYDADGQQREEYERQQTNAVAAVCAEEGAHHEYVRKESEEEEKEKEEEALRGLLMRARASQLRARSTRAKDRHPAARLHRLRMNCCADAGQPRLKSQSDPIERHVCVCPMERFGTGSGGAAGEQDGTSGRLNADALELSVRHGAGS